MSENTSFFAGFVPRIIHVFYRDENFWRETNYLVTSKSIILNNFSYVVQGRGSLEMDGALYDLKEGCLFYFPRESVMNLRSSKVHPLCYYIVQFAQTFVEWEGMEARLQQKEPNFPFQPGVLIEDYEVKWQMKQVYQIWNSNDPDSEWKARIVFLAALQRCGEWFSDNQQRTDENARLIGESVKFIKAHFHEEIDRESLARACNLSVSYYSLSFKKHTGYTPTQYIAALRIEHAKRQLRSTQDLVAEVARASGFRDPLYFTRLFTREVGMSPTDYRNA